MEESALSILHMKKKAEGSATFNFEGLYLTFIYLVELFRAGWLPYFQIEFSSGNYYTLKLKSPWNPEQITWQY